MSDESKKNIVFILGAGASAPYSFPTGDQLVKFAIKAGTNQTISIHDKEYYLYKEFRSQLKKYVHESVIKNFVTDLANSQRDSIDSFIRNHKHYNEVAKYTIAIRLLIDESRYSSLINYEHNWIKLLINQLMPNDKSSFRCDFNLKFITFNYDRLLEKIIFDSIKATFSSNDNTIKQIFNDSIYVHHVYGDMGNIAELENTTKSTQCFGSLNSLEIAVRNMNVMFEERRPDMSHVIELLNTAYKIYVLGFGFDQFNLDTLGVNFNEITKMHEGKIFISQFKSNSSNINHIRNKINCLNDNVIIEACDCYELLSRYIHAVPKPYNQGVNMAK